MVGFSYGRADCGLHGNGAALGVKRWSLLGGIECRRLLDWQIAYLYFEDEPQRQMSMKRLSRDEAFLIAVNIAKLPSVPRQILKDISWPPNSASRDD